MTSKTIVLHIGAPKCGSTYLQRVLLRNQNLLARHGIHYPHADDGRTHAGNARRIYEKVEAGLISKYFAKGVDTVFLSHEDLFARPQWGVSLSQWARNEGVSLRIIAFLRPYNEIVFGAYSQYMKQNWRAYLNNRAPYDGMNFREFALDRFRRTNYALAIKKWDDLAYPFGIEIFYYRRSRDAVESILGAIPGMDWSLDKKLSNISLRVQDCESIAKAMLNPHFPEEEIRELLSRAYEDYNLPDSGRSEDRIAWLEDLHAERNKIIEHDFGYSNFLAKDN